MTVEQIRQLRPGDEVFWNDPDQGLCSRTVKVSAIEIYNEEDGDCSMLITSPDGDDLACFASELA
jgi:hypothetical protein